MIWPCAEVDNNFRLVSPILSNFQSDKKRKENCQATPKKSQLLQEATFPQPQLENARSKGTPRRKIKFRSNPLLPAGPVRTFALQPEDHCH